MEQVVSNVQKKSFLRWVLDRHLLVNREIIWLIHYLMSNDQLLGMIHIVDDVEGCTRSMILTHPSKNKPNFRYFKASVSTGDPEKAFHDLRMNQQEEIYIELDIEDVRQSPIYFSVLEENPNNTVDVHEKYGQLAEYTAGKAEQTFTTSRLTEAINQALDNGDKERFYVLSEQLISLNQEKNKQPS
ncbi:YpiB family protein [Sporolactobacillus kofuensis]|uniref:YpiB family protein n=1 Tax=Sporolactobacillus kofuensis TaxID=269672 RepID=A0ABW1WDH4_9BACL|nr:YpiB family protein [Sporolactobacillus kofuensis]MCO7176749.1 YpiB family protein [Sporolactobacillus kofuensis]